MTSPTEPTDGAPRPLVDTTRAAEALRISEHTLTEWADAGMITPTATDPDGTRWWNLHDLRRELAKYLPDQG